jgi:hypothetical protein
MMKKLMMMLLLYATTMGVSAQENEKKSSFFDNTNFEIKTLYGLKQHSMQPLNLSMQLSYSFSDKLSLMVAIERNHTQIDLNDYKTYANSTLLGGGLAYVWMKDHSYCYDARLQVLNSIGSPLLKQMTFDIGINLYGRCKKHRLSPIIGLGFRYQQSHTIGIRDWGGLYAIVGIRF